MYTPTDSATVSVSHQSSDIDDEKGKLPKSTCDQEIRVEIKLTDQTNLLPFRKIIVVFLGLASCIVVTSLDSTIVATALPTISSAFNAGSISSWVPSASLLTSTAFQPLYGRFSDIFGRKATLCVAMLLFIIGSLGGGLSRSMIELIIFRGVSGAGGGGIITLGQVVVSDVVSLRDRGKYQGVIICVNTFGYAVGPLIGGVLAQKVSWRWCFWITIPLSAVATLIVIFVLPLKPVRGNIKSKLLAVDYLGAALTLAGCTLILLPVIWGGVTFPWTSLKVVATLFSGLCLLVIFCVWEWKGAKLPIVPMYIFRHVTVSGVYITMFIFGFIYWSSLFYIPQFFQVALGYSPIHSGLFLLPILVSQTTASLFAGLSVSRTGKFRTTVYCGFTIWAIGLGCLSTLNPSKPKVEHVIFMLFAGIGAGMTQQTTIVAAQACVSRADMSVVTAVRNFLRFVGGTLSLAVGSSIVNNSLLSSARSVGLAPDTLKQITEDPTVLSNGGLNISSEHAHVLNGYISGFRYLFILNAGLAAMAAVVAFFMIKHQELIREDDTRRKVEASQSEEIEMRISGIKEVDVERVDIIVPASAMTLTAFEVRAARTSGLDDGRFSFIMPRGVEDRRISVTVPGSMRGVEDRRLSVTVPERRLTLTASDVDSEKISTIGYHS
ncbi:major facilitator superfamily domain-containing protein [Gautieria morchelliformis]|nr:major facilitator superfamily domain-containing protein [Gautieria morchelliformis]